MGVNGRSKPFKLSKFRVGVNGRSTDLKFAVGVGYRCQLLMRVLMSVYGQRMPMAGDKPTMVTNKIEQPNLSE